MKIEVGKTYKTRRGDTVTDLSYNKHGEDEPENYNGTLTYPDGTLHSIIWSEDGRFMGSLSDVPDGDHPSDIVEEITNGEQK